MQQRPFAITISVFVLSACIGHDSHLFAQNERREQIGVVLGKPVFRDQLHTEKDNPSLADELHRLFSTPLYDVYNTAHKEEVTPTEREIEFTRAYLRKEHEVEMQREGEKLRKELAEVDNELKSPGLDEESQRRLKSRRWSIESRLAPPPRFVAEYLLTQWKFQRHLYEKFGGGRVLFQQAGLEAFDAMHEFLKQHEKKGDFRIDDESLRKEFYAYWTTMNHGAFLSDSKDSIRDFLNPAWAPKPETQPASRPVDGG